MAKVTAAELDQLIMLIPRVSWTQLDRLHDLIHAEQARKAPRKAAEKKETPA